VRAMGGSGRFRVRGLLWAVVVCSAALSLAGCADGPAGTSAGDGRVATSSGEGRAAPPQGGHPSAALAQWRAFPVTADPRPLVVTSGRVIDPLTGFRTGDDKVAYLAGDFELATALPPAPARSGGYPIVSAKNALGQLRSTGSGQPAAAHPLRIQKVSLVQARFGTDRGLLRLPAWQFDLDQVSHPVQVLAVAPERLWPARLMPPTSPDFHASLHGDQRSLDYSFYGSPPGPSPCGADYAGEVSESRTAVVVSIRQLEPNPVGSSAPQACPAFAAQRKVTVRLSGPLAGRVLLTPDGLAIPVTSR
jgi:hypothetical protein